METRKDIGERTASTPRAERAADMQTEMVTAMVTEIVTDTAGFARLRPDWDRLARRDPTPALFRCFSWQFEWWRALGGGRRLQLVVARRGGAVVGILPLFEEAQGAVRRLALVASQGGGSDYLDALCEDEAVRERLLETAASLGADLLELDDVDSASPTLPLVRRLAHARGQIAEQQVRYPCPFIPVQVPFERYLAQVARRETLKRREKWFAQQPGFRVTCETAPDAVAPFLARFYRLHAARWRDDGGSQAFSDARLGRFHAQITQRYADEGRLRLWTLWVAGEAVAVAYAFDDDDRSLYYQSGFLPAWGARSAGAVLFARYVEDAFQRGLREVDLLRGSEPYKADWTKEGRQTESVRWALTQAGARALALREAKATVRSGLKRLLPDEARRGLARIVREGRMQGAA